MGERLVRVVLVVDDDERILAVCRGLREWRVVTATSASTAAELSKQHEFDLAIVDLHLDGASGVSVVRELKKKQPQLPVAVVSGNPSMGLDWWSLFKPERISSWQADHTARDPSAT